MTDSDFADFLRSLEERLRPYGIALELAQPRSG